MSIGLVLFLFASQVANIAAEYRADQPSAVIWKDQFVRRRRGDKPCCGVPLSPGTVAFARRGVRPPAEYWNPSSAWRNYQAKLDIRDDRILLFAWAAYYILPMSDLPVLERNAFGDALLKTRGSL